VHSRPSTDSFAEGKKLSAILYDLNDCLDLPFSETHIYIYFAQVLNECMVS
jgi:hypothetical protein